MKCLWRYGLLTIGFYCIILSVGVAQGELPSTFKFEVSKVYPYITIRPQEVAQATTLMDLNPRYPVDWVRSYRLVEITAMVGGQLQRAVGAGATLNPAQRSLLTQVDTGTPITVNIQYLPENTLRHNDPRVMDFSFTPVPEQAATFTGGQAGLEQYLQETVVNTVDRGAFTAFDIVAMTFTVSASGQVEAPELFWSSEEATVNTLLLEAIRKMPDWAPATYADGTAVPQKFALIVGNLESCVVNLLRVRPLPLASNR